MTSGASSERANEQEQFSCFFGEKLFDGAHVGSRRGRAVPSIRSGNACILNCQGLAGAGRKTSTTSTRHVIAAAVVRQVAQGGVLVDALRQRSWDSSLSYDECASGTSSQFLTLRRRSSFVVLEEALAVGVVAMALRQKVLQLGVLGRANLALVRPKAVKPSTFVLTN